MFLEKLRDSQPAQVVYSYAPEDKNNISEFDKYLRVLKRNGLIKTWSEQNILAGENLQQVKYNKLKNADIVLLMLSPDFFVHEESMNIYDTILSLGTSVY